MSAEFDQVSSKKIYEAYDARGNRFVLEVLWILWSCPTYDENGAALEVEYVYDVYIVDDENNTKTEAKLSVNYICNNDNEESITIVPKIGQQHTLLRKFDEDTSYKSKCKYDITEYIVKDDLVSLKLIIDCEKASDVMRTLKNAAIVDDV